ncbi:uncharacterized protein LOC126902419 isoform X2 [Daktulosphaira vitifoliae]|uniref:uncharacterized protein LOC126902419 isoform X2 n=1 Tax=Daktulosphaira vitifoliae TaxID=58002 RepID=UPI0021A9BBE7|nr:uncharacterized protein LOC126902419 isoform X2 [Daktulosphaira vitifoliae]
MMLLFKKYIICFLICSVQVIEAPRVFSKSKSIDDANAIYTFFKIVCWQNLNDVATVKYFGDYYTKQDILELPFDRETYSRRIRIATLFLGCSYANDLQYIFFMLKNLCTFCHSIDDPKQMYNCSVEIINNTLAIIPMLKKMKGAMDIIESYHTQPWNTNRLIRYMMSSVFNSYGSIKESLNNLQPSQDDPEITKPVLEYFNNYLNKYMTLVNIEIVKFCLTDHVDLNSLWNEYKYRSSHNPNIEFHHYLNVQVRNKIYNTIINKFFKLGFLYNIQTEMVSIPLEVTLPDDNKEINLNISTTDTLPKTVFIEEEGFTSYANLNEAYLISILHNEELRYISTYLTTPIENQINYETGENSQQNDLNDKPFYNFI